MAIIWLEGSVHYADESSFKVTATDPTTGLPSWQEFGVSSRVTSFRTGWEFEAYYQYGSRRFSGWYSRGFRGSVSVDFLVNDLGKVTEFLEGSYTIRFIRGSSLEIKALGSVLDSFRVSFTAKEAVKATADFVFADVSTGTESVTALTASGPLTWKDITVSGLDGIVVQGIELSVRNNPEMVYTFGGEKPSTYYLKALEISGTVRGFAEDDTAISTLLGKTEKTITITDGTKTITLSGVYFVNVDDSLDVASADPVLRRGVEFRARDISVA